MCLPCVPQFNNQASNQAAEQTPSSRWGYYSPARSTIAAMLFWYTYFICWLQSSVRWASSFLAWLIIDAVFYCFAFLSSWTESPRVPISHSTMLQATQGVERLKFVHSGNMTCFTKLCTSHKLYKHQNLKTHGFDRHLCFVVMQGGSRDAGKADQSEVRWGWAEEPGLDEGQGRGSEP